MSYECKSMEQHRSRILIEIMDAEKAPFQMKSRLLAPKVGFSTRKTDFSAEKVSFQCPYTFY